jgi:hypothetical protein
MFQNKQHRQSLLVALIFLGFTILTVGVIWHTQTIFVGSDRLFHLQRVEEVYQNFKHHHFWSYIATYTFGQRGQMVNIFYPWLPIVPYAIAHFWIKNPINSFYVVTFLKQLVALTVAYFAYKRIRPKRFEAVVFACSYCCMGYFYWDIFPRFDIGEAWALIAAPVVFSELYLLLKGEKQRWFGLTLGLIWITYCHVLSAGIALFFVVIFYLMTKLVSRSRDWQLREVGKSILLYAIGTMGFSIPLIDQVTHVSVYSPTIYNFSKNVKPISKMILTSVENQQTLDFGNLGWIIFVLPIGLFFLKNSSLFYKLNFGLGLAVTAMSTNLFPWPLLQNTPIQILQFPERLLGWSSIFLAVCTAMIAGRLAQQKGDKWRLGILLILAFTSLYSDFAFIQNQHQYIAYRKARPFAIPWASPLKQSDYHLNFERVPSNDYAPDKVVKQVQQLTAKQWEKQNGYQIKSAPNQVTYQFNQKSKQVDQLQFFIYQAKQYQVTINGQNVQLTQNNTMLKIPKRFVGKLKNVTVQFKVPFIYKLTRTISVLVVGFLLGARVYLWILLRQEQQKRLMQAEE